MTLFACNVVIALSLNVINGMAGQFSIGHAGFVGIGAYTGAVVASNLHVVRSAAATHLPELVHRDAARARSPRRSRGIFGLLVGLPSLRLRGDYLAIVTLGFAEIFRLVIATAQTGGNAEAARRPSRARRTERLRGAQGQRACPSTRARSGSSAPCCSPPSSRGASSSPAGVAPFAPCATTRSPPPAVGVDPTRYKVTSFVIAAAGAGVAGGLLAIDARRQPHGSARQFNFNYSFDLITMVILGGSGSVSGAVVGGVFVTFTVKLIEQLQGLEQP